MTDRAAYRSRAWFGDEERELVFPEHWDVTISEIRNAPALSVSQLGECIDKPSASKSLEDLAKAYDSAVILCEDHTRPLIVHDLICILLDRLNKGGIPDNSIRILIANGTHRPMSYQEQIHKFGLDVLKRIEVLPHNCYDNQRWVGRTKRGTPVTIDGSISEKDLLIGISGIYPHGMAGFSGGAKIILPGVSGIETIEHNHRELSGASLKLDGNDVREDMEEAAQLSGLKFSVNCVVNASREICAVVAGDFIIAHRKACKIAKSVYESLLPDYADVLVINAYPMDSELFQAAKALAVTQYYPMAKHLILICSCDEGFGYHALCGPHGRLNDWEKKNLENSLKGLDVYVASEMIGRQALLQKFPPWTKLFATPEQAIENLDEELGRASVKAIFFRCAPIEIVTFRT